MGKSHDVRPDPLELLKRITTDGRRRAIFRVYAGYARGTGTTNAMLNEARRRAGRGTDVVVAAYSVHGEPSTALAGLVVVGAARRRPERQRMDLVAVLARNPEVVCVDDLMAPDVEGRPVFESVPRLLAAGITVLATLHVLSVRSVAEAVSSMLDEPLQEPLLDDRALAMIDEFELVDVPPEELLRRIRERSLLAPAELAMAMQRELRPAVLQLLREMAIRMVAEHGDTQLGDYLPAAPFEFRGRIVLCLPVQPGLEDRIRATARYAAAQDAKFTVVVVRTRSLSDEQRAWLGGYAALAHQLRGQFVRLDSRCVGPALARYIRDSQATEVVLGHRRRSRWWPWDTTSEVIRRLSGVDVHILRARPPKQAALA